MNEKEFYDFILEEIDKKIELLREERKNYEKAIFVSNEMLRIQTIIPIITMIIGIVDVSVTKNLGFLNTLLYGGVCGFIGALPVVLLTSLYFFVAKKIYNKKIVKIDKSIDFSLEAKRMIIHGLVEEKEKEIENNLGRNSIPCISRQEDMEVNKSKTLIKKK